MTQPVAQRYVGERVPRTEDARILTGTGRYVDDIHLPGMLHAAFLRSPVPHALITSIDVSAAREHPGVLLAMSGADVQALLPPDGVSMSTLGPSPVRFTLLATDKVRLVGDLVAVVVAESRALAEDALELIDVDYDELSPVASADEALDPSSPPIFAELGSNVIAGPTTNTHGDVDGLFARADRVVRANIRQHRHQNVPMECRGAVAEYDPQSERFTLHASNQSVGLTQMLLAPQLGIPADKVRVLCGDVGGSFGLKLGVSREEVAISALARTLERPVKWTEDRNEHLSASGHAREETLEAEVAITNDGEILAIKAAMVIDAGAYPGLSHRLADTVERMMPGPYSIDGLEFSSTVAVTNKATYVAYRGPWAAESFCRERMIDIIARELGVEPLEIRRRNLPHQGVSPRTMITGLSLAGVTARESIERVAELVDFPAFRQRQTAARAEGRYLGIGIATFIETAPGPRGRSEELGPENLQMRIEDNGTMTVITGQMPHGQSHETTLAQIAADEFGMPIEHIRIITGDTDIVPFGLTGGSRSATMTGGATLHNARALRDKVREAASELFETSAEDIEIVDGIVGVKGVPVSGKPLADIIAEARQPGRLADGTDVSFEVAHGYDGGEGGWSGGTHCAIVEVDTETGIVKIERYLAVEDCGLLINPGVVDGQVRGGVAQGIGAVLLERSAYDENAQFLAGTFMDYLLPTMNDIPRIEVDHLETVPIDPHVNFRGVGEGGMIIAPPTLCNAIEDALTPFGVDVREQHLPPLRILELIGALD